MKLKIWKLLTVNVGIGKQWEISFLQVHYKVFVMLTVLQNQLLPQFHLFLSRIPHWLQSANAQRKKGGSGWVGECVSDDDHLRKGNALHSLQKPNKP
jgi:hypothetical protein